MTTPKELLEQMRGTPTMCGCGMPLVPALHESGNRVGVTHTEEDDWHHTDYFSGIRVARQ